MMGGPEMAPPYPPALGMARATRGPPRSHASFAAPPLAPQTPQRSRMPRQPGAPLDHTPASGTRARFSSQTRH